MSQRTVLKLLAFSLGANSIGIQIILLRQFMTVFYGNELVFGVVLALWLLWVGCGSAVGHVWWKRRTPSLRVFAYGVVLQLMITCGLFIAVKYVRLLCAVPYGEFLSFGHILGFAALSLLFPAVLVGFLFALVAGLYDHTAETDSAAVVYSYEALGTVAVGLAFTFLPAVWSGFHSLMLLAVLQLIFLLSVTRSKAILIGGVLLVAVLFSAWPQKFETVLLNKYWHTVDETFQLTDWRYTRFGQSAIVDWGGEKILYHNGIKVSSLENTMDNQALAATVLVQHPHPQKILCIEGNSSGLALECAKWGVQVDVMEVDGAMFRFAQQHMSTDQQHAWTSNAIRVQIADARRVLKRANNAWDMIIVNVGAPTTALSNRYYTSSFFRLAKNSLATDGLLALCHFPAGENFLGDELLSLNTILTTTLSNEFSDLLMLPGDDAIYFASNSTSSLSRSVPELEQRYNRLHPDFDYFDVSMLSYIYQPSRIDDFAALLHSSSEKRLNSDFTPVSYLYDFLIWHKIVRGHNTISGTLFSLSSKSLLILLLAGLVVGLLILFMFPSTIINPLLIRMAAAVIGFAGMTFSVVLLLAFQTLFGYIYTWVGLAMAAYMAGTAAASLLVVKKMSSANTRFALTGLLLFTITTLLFFLPIIQLVSHFDSALLFLSLFILAGALVGAAFPLLCRFYSQVSGESELGSIYAADVIGGAVGAFLISSFFIPLYGFFYTLLLTAIFCAAECLLLVLRGKRRQV